jgi:hypothetical protein
MAVVGVVAGVVGAAGITRIEETLLLHEPTHHTKSKAHLPVRLEHFGCTSARCLSRIGHSRTRFGVEVLHIRCGLIGLCIDALSGFAYVGLGCLPSGSCGSRGLAGRGAGGGGGRLAGVVRGEAMRGAELLVA